MDLLHTSLLPPSMSFALLFHVIIPAIAPVIPVSTCVIPVKTGIQGRHIPAQAGIQQILSSSVGFGFPIAWEWDKGW